jgi:hypothetical protein
MSMSIFYSIFWLGGGDVGISLAVLFDMIHLNDDDTLNYPYILSTKREHFLNTLR